MWYMVRRFQANKILWRSALSELRLLGVNLRALGRFFPIRRSDGSWQERSAGVFLPREKWECLTTIRIPSAATRGGFSS